MITKMISTPYQQLIGLYLYDSRPYFFQSAVKIWQYETILRMKTVKATADQEKYNGSHVSKKNLFMHIKIEYLQEEPSTRDTW